MPRLRAATILPPPGNFTDSLDLQSFAAVLGTESIDDYILGLTVLLPIAKSKAVFRTWPAQPATFRVSGISVHIQASNEVKSRTPGIDDQCTSPRSAVIRCSTLMHVNRRFATKEGDLARQVQRRDAFSS
jgi:hypothetical protein